VVKSPTISPPPPVSQPTNGPPPSEDIGGIENRNHYVRDVAFDEDASRIRHNPGIMARARSFALNIMRKNRITNVAQALWNGGLNLDHILAYKAI
jgi:hypothetical protein